MSIKVYNTLTKQKEEFIPLEEGKVKIYVCGVTPYNKPHIGNARPFVTWDVIRRYLEYKGYKVTHIQNFTDVDDKIINTANIEGVTAKEIAERYIAEYFNAIDQLNVLRAHVYPKVSDHMQEIIAMVEKLVQNGHAYEVDGDVYYSVESFAGYGKLSGRNLDDMQAGARVDVDERKRHPMDFALWKAAKEGEPSWSSPWGEGRPGWHIECSAMSLKYLGERFDFHGGGSDLVFPHHENEIAQSEAATGVSPFVNYWLHNGFITVNEEKMSKSVGNFFLVSDILEHFSPEVLRFFIIATHYRSPLDFSDARLEEAKKSLERLRTAWQNGEALLAMTQSTEQVAEQKEKFSNLAEKAAADFAVAMDDDFNTALAIATLFEMAKEINIYYSNVVTGKDVLDKQSFAILRNYYCDMMDVLGILVGERAGDVANGTGENGEWQRKFEDAMDIILSIRQESRTKKDWATADLIRNKLQEMGIKVEDSPQGARWFNID